MLKKALFIGFILFSSLFVSAIVLRVDNKIIVDDKKDSLPMPIVRDEAFCHLEWGGIPQEQRDEKYRKWLSVSLKISVSNASGSGTIIYYDNKENYAYVQSCGHLWNGSMTAEAGKKIKLKCKVITWYKNEIKLSSPQEYPAEVLYYSNVQGKDCSLLRFKPDWSPYYIPIAPDDYKYVSETRFHSCGCDGGRECSHYDVKFAGIQGANLITTENSPRPGRSGGGLMTDDLFVGICWGTTDVTGKGNGIFTPLNVLRKMNQQNGYGWLNEMGVDWARKIPIKDHMDSNKKFPIDYIPVPND